MKYLLLITISILMNAGVTNNFTGGTLIEADKVNANFTDTYYKHVTVKRIVPSAQGGATTLDPIPGRDITFNKEILDTGIKVTYSDTMRSYQGYCAIELLVDGVSCDNRMVYMMYSNNLADPHMYRSLDFYCDKIGTNKISVGTHKITMKWQGSNYSSIVL